MKATSWVTVRYSLRTFLILITVFSLSIGYWVRLADQQRRAASEFRRLYCDVHYGYPSSRDNRSSASRWWKRAEELLGEDMLYPVEGLSATVFRLRDSDLELLRCFPKLRRLSFHGSSISTEGLHHVAQLDRLEELEIYSDEITNQGLTAFHHLKDLRKLSLNCPQIDGRGLRHLNGQSLENLTIMFAGKLDDGLPDLCEMTTLRRLDLSGSKVTDDAVDSLKRLTWLDSISLHGTELSQAADTELREALSIVATRRPAIDRAARSRRPNREMNCWELEELRSCKEILLLPRHKARVDAMDRIAALRHRDVVPILETIAREPSEESSFRGRAIYSLVLLRDPRVVDLLIDLLTDEKLAALSARLLPFYVNVRSNFRFQAKGYHDQQRLWRDWWIKNRERTILSTSYRP